MTVAKYIFNYNITMKYNVSVTFQMSSVFIAEEGKFYIFGILGAPKVSFGTVASVRTVASKVEKRIGIGITRAYAN